MALDFEKIKKDILGFYTFIDKTVISVGAAGDGSLMPYVACAKRVTVIDSNEKGLKILEVNIKKNGWENKVSLRLNDFYKEKSHADVIFFEFCFHELEDPQRAVDHARTMAEDIIIIDHYVDGDTKNSWSYFTEESDKIQKSFAAIPPTAIKKMSRFSVDQTFTDYEELHAKFKKYEQDGAESVCGMFEKIEIFKGEKPIRIPMPYVLLRL